MKPGNDKLRTRLEKALAQLEEEEEKTAVTPIRPIILANLEQKRVENWLGTGAERTPCAYVRLVWETYARYSHYLRQLQVEKSDDVWQDLYAQLQRWAYNYLLRKNFRRGQTTLQLAADYATEAAMILLTARFPYDRNFTPWSRVLLQNVCKREIRQTRKASRLPDEKQTTLDDKLYCLRDDNCPQELRYALLDAIERLPHESWREALLMRYIEGLTPAEIAQKTGKTASAVYNLHFKAITALREIWGVNVYKDK